MYDPPMLQRYFGFYMHQGDRIRWDASATTPVYCVRPHKHRRPRVQPGRRIIPAPEFYVVVDEDVPSLKLGHLKVQQPPDRAPFIQYVAIWRTLIADIAERHGMEIHYDYGRTYVTYGAAEVADLTGYAELDQYDFLCQFTGQDSWL